MFEYRSKNPKPNSFRYYWQDVPNWTFASPEYFDFGLWEYRIDGKKYTEDSEEFRKLLSWYTLKYV